MIRDGDTSYLDNANVLITGGTGSLGKQLIRKLLQASVHRIAIYSRDEYKQHLMQQDLTGGDAQRVRFLLGDVRDAGRLRRAFDGVDFVIHTAALKQVPAAEYNPFEFVNTNVIGAENVINAAIDMRVKKVVALSTDKAANPINLYGATKLCSDKLFVSGNSYSGRHRTRFCVVRYGNVVGSRGSVIPFFLAERKKGVLPITDARMTRFWITLDQAAAFVLNALREMRGGEIWVPRIPSMRITDLAEAIAPECELRHVGIRPGEKLHEIMIPVDDGRQTMQFEHHFVVRPAFSWWPEDWHAGGEGAPCPDGFYYGSDNNPEWLDRERLARMIAALDILEAREWAEAKGLT
jgi:UDP-N-acetylglucosamine 4,6-dehydratase